jgi:hypothetical protein
MANSEQRIGVDTKGEGMGDLRYGSSVVFAKIINNKKVLKTLSKGECSQKITNAPPPPRIQP